MREELTPNMDEGIFLHDETVLYLDVVAAWLTKFFKTPRTVH